MFAAAKNGYVISGETFKKAVFLIKGIG